MEELAREFAATASFFTIWTREAHPGGDYPQPEDLEARARYARDCRKADDALIPYVLDDMEASLAGRLGGFPNSLHIADSRGRLVYRATWADHREVKRVLERLRLIGQRLGTGEPVGMPRWSEEVLPTLHDNPAHEAVTAIGVWESARNFDEPERFMGPERARAFRAVYARAVGRESIRPRQTPDRPPTS